MLTLFELLAPLRQAPAGVALRGPCRQCGEETEHVALWRGKPVKLCPRCSAAIREA